MRLRRSGSKALLQSLREVSLLATCSEKELTRIASLATDFHVEAGRVLTVVDEPGAEFFIIIHGVATVWRGHVRLDTLGPGSFFGELSLFDRGVRSATVVAETDMRLLVLSRKEFLSPHFLQPSVMERMLSEIGRRLRRADHGLAVGRTDSKANSGRCGATSPVIVKRTPLRDGAG